MNDNQQAREVTAEFRKKLTGMRKLNGEAAGMKSTEENAAAITEGTKGN